MCCCVDSRLTPKFNPLFDDFKKIFDEDIPKEYIKSIFDKMTKISMFLDKNYPQYKEVNRRSWDYLIDFNQEVEKHNLNKAIVFTEPMYRDTIFKICVLWVCFCAKICNLKGKKKLFKALLEM